MGGLVRMKLPTRKMLKRKVGAVGVCDAVRCPLKRQLQKTGSTCFSDVEADAMWVLPVRSQGYSVHS